MKALSKNCFCQINKHKYYKYRPPVNYIKCFSKYPEALVELSKFALISSRLYVRQRALAAIQVMNMKPWRLFIWELVMNRRHWLL